MQVAIIDMGTNTFNLLIAEVIQPNSFKKIYSSKFPVNLGEGGILKQQLMPDAIARGLQAMRECQQIIAQYTTSKIVALATSAIREASNGKFFISQVQELGIEVEIISGDREAELIYQGVKLSTDLGDEISLIIDIGGGSVEFILANSTRIFFKNSYKLGVARLKAQFNPSNPITYDEIEAINAFLDSQLQDLLIVSKKYKISKIIGASGSFDSYAEIIALRNSQFHYAAETTFIQFEFNDVSQLFNELMRSTINDRKQIKGLVPMRVEVIVLAVIITQFVLRNFKNATLCLSRYSLKEGVLNNILNS